MIVSLTTYIIGVLICYGVAYLLNVEIVDIIAFVALAIGVDNLTRID